MMSRSKKADDVESDSDWDSLPGDVSERESSPAPTKSSSSRAPTLSPVPPKQPYSKHATSSKPVNMYKNSSNPIQKLGSATTFEDRTGGLWNDDDNHSDEIKVSFSKENNNNVKMNNEVTREKKVNDKIASKQQEKTKKAPYTDFREALSTPIPAAPNPKEQHKMAGVNQAYRIESTDEVQTNHDSWDDSENESPLRRSDRSTINTKTTDEVMTERCWKPQAKGIYNRTLLDTKTTEEVMTEKSWRPQTKGIFNSKMVEIDHGNHHVNTNQNFENCCLIQVTQGAFDDRHRPSFFHGSKNHFHVKEDDPRATITDIADKSEVILQRFWREVFGVLQILINFFLIFILELFKTIIHSIRYLLTGILYTTGDHFIKPLVSATFNNIVQPFSVLLLNVFTIFANLLKPILALTREIFSQIAIPLQAFRLFSFNADSRRNGTALTQI